MKNIVGVVAFFVLLPYFVLINGWAFSMLWGWFIVPQFGLSPLSIPAACGVYFVIAYATHQQNKDGNEGDPLLKKIWSAYARVTIKPLFYLAFGAVLRMWLP